MTTQTAPQLNGFERVFMNITDPALPPYVRRLTPAKREQWIAHWNAAYATCSLEDGGDCAAKAFTRANAKILANAHPTNAHGKFNEISAYDAADDVRLFMDAPALAGFAEGTVSVGPAKPFKAPEWVPYLPIPHTYTHPSYGKIDINRARNEEFAANFKAGIYQTRIPLDAEHQYKLSGAVGWIVDMRVNAQGGVDAKVEWTDTGLQLLKEKRFRYISPEFYSKWMHPATNVAYNNIATGGALTTRPFFKEPYLQQIPLIASERGLSVPEGWDASNSTKGENGEANIVVKTLTVPMITVATEEGTEMQEITPERYAELINFEQTATMQASQLATFAEQVQALTTELATAQAALAEQTALVLDQKAAALSTKFSEALRGTPNAEKHLAHVLRLAQSFGEDDAIVTDYVASQQAAAATVRTGQAFNEIGSAAPSNNGAGNDSAEARIGKLAGELSRSKNIPVARAWVEIMEAQPQLYAEYKSETGRV